MSDINAIKAVMAQRELARRSLYRHLEYKFKYFYNRPFLNNWHIGYICELLEAVLSGEITRLMLNMPPSYGKTEIIARTFIPYAIGKNDRHKFIYTSYGNDLSAQTSSEARDYFKSIEFKNVFGHENLSQDQTSHWRLPSGGGLYATTIGGAITGFHAHTILIDDPLKASEANSKAALKTVSNYFTNSLLSRLDETAERKASIVIIMQRLHKNDLCGELLRERGDEWTNVTLQALNKKPQVYSYNNFSYERAANEPLHPKKHNLEDLVTLRAQMGNAEFEAQYQQDPSESVGGVFEMNNFSTINEWEMPNLSEYIFVDSAESLSDSADNRAIVCEGWAIDENDRELCVMLDCLYGKWDEDAFINNIVDMMMAHKTAPAYIEQAGGGITITRLLQKKITQLNAKFRSENKDVIINPVNAFTPLRKISKNDGILAMRTYFNTGQLRFKSGARGLEQIRSEFEKFNPAKSSNQDDCIDALSKGFILPGAVSPKKTETKTPIINARFGVKKTWRI